MPSDGAPDTCRRARGALEDGRLILQTGWRATKRIAVWARHLARDPRTRSRAAGAASSPRRTALLESLEQALAALTVAEFGREGAWTTAR